MSVHFPAPPPFPKSSAQELTFYLLFGVLCMVNVLGWYLCGLMLSKKAHAGRRHRAAREPLMLNRTWSQSWGEDV